MDNDVYGHVNNVTYYSYFDTVVNEHLIAAGVLDVETSPVFGVVVETGCRFLDSLTFPEVVDAGLRVAQLGTHAASATRSASSTRAPTRRRRSATSSTSTSTAGRAGPRRSRTASGTCLEPLVRVQP